MGGGEAYALTCPLMTKADGGKFGKTESGTIWLDKNRTSPYEFYQFWLNASDDDIIKYLKTFSLKPQEEIELLYSEHQEVPHLRIMQKALAQELTTRVHSEKECDMAIKASGILFGKSTKDDLQSLDERSFLSVFKGVKQSEISRDKLKNGIDIIDLLASESGFLSSNGEARRSLKQNAISLNKEKVDESFVVKPANLINNKYILLQKGKKNYFVLKFID
jgi:tyrosyl-tRNA synthetase